MAKLRRVQTPYQCRNHILNYTDKSLGVQDDYRMYADLQIGTPNPIYEDATKLKHCSALDHGHVLEVLVLKFLR